MSSHEAEVNNTADSKDELLRQLERFRVRSHRAGRAHYLASQRAAAMHTRLGLPSIVLSTAVSTAIFGTLTAGPSTALVVVTGAVSLAAAVLTAVQTFFTYSERAEKHREAGAEYAALKREWDVLRLSIALSAAVRSENLDKLASLVKELNSLEQRVPHVPDLLYDRARREQENDREGV